MDAVRPKPARMSVWVPFAVVAMAFIVAFAIWSAGQVSRLVDRQEAARKLVALGARVHWDCHLIRNGEWYYVTDVHITRPGFPDYGFSLLHGLTGLKGLHLHGTWVTDATLDRVCDLPDLRYLVLQGTAGHAGRHRRPQAEAAGPHRHDSGTAESGKVT